MGLYDEAQRELHELRDENRLSLEISSQPGNKKLRDSSGSPRNRPRRVQSMAVKTEYSILKEAQQRRKDMLGSRAKSVR